MHVAPACARSGEGSDCHGPVCYSSLVNTVAAATIAQLGLGVPSSI
jgi:hypothetical protein